MATESDNQATPPIALDDPSDQMLCVLIRVLDTPEGLIAFPDRAVVAQDDVVLWFAEPGLGAFKIGLEAVDALEVKTGGDGGKAVDFAAAGTWKDSANGKEEPAHVWRAGASHLVSATPKRGVPTRLRYWLWKADGGTPGKAMTLLTSPPRRQVFGTSGTVRPTDPP